MTLSAIPCPMTATPERASARGHGGQSDKRSNPSPRVRLAIYTRDQYTFRYAHCQRATVDERVVAALSRLIPEALPYERHWPDNSTHPLLWTHLASLEHVWRGRSEEQTTRTTSSRRVRGVTTQRVSLGGSAGMGGTPAARSRLGWISLVPAGSETRLHGVDRRRMMGA